MSTPDTNDIVRPCPCSPCARSRFNKPAPHGALCRSCPSSSAPYSLLAEHMCPPARHHNRRQSSSICAVYPESLCAAPSTCVGNPLSPDMRRLIGAWSFPPLVSQCVRTSSAYAPSLAPGAKAQCRVPRQLKLIVDLRLQPGSMAYNACVLLAPHACCHGLDLRILSHCRTQHLASRSLPCTYT